MSSIAIKTNQKLWNQSKQKAIQKLGGKWSARAAQLATKYYKQAGGKYIGKKSKSNRLSIWTREKWRTKSGLKSSLTGERYLPSYVIKKLSNREYAASSRKKRSDTLKGKQWSKQPRKIAKKTSELRRILDDYLSE